MANSFQLDPTTQIGDLGYNFSNCIHIFFNFFLVTEDQHADVKAHEAVNHMTSFYVKKRGDFIAAN